MEVVRIRPFTLLDLNQIIEIENASFTVDAFSEDTFKTWYRKCPDLFIVAENEGRIVGYMITCILPDKGDVVSIAVNPHYRRKGVGRALAEFTFKYLKLHHFKVIELEVRITNSDGICFWKRLGFFPIGIIKRFYCDGADALRMRKLLEKE